VVVGELCKVDLTHERNSLHGTPAGHVRKNAGVGGTRASARLGLGFLLEPEGERVAMVPPTKEQVAAAKNSSEKKTQLGAGDFLTALLKTSPYLASLLFVMVIVAGIVTVVPSLPQVGVILVWVVALAIVGIILAALRGFLKGKVLSVVGAFCAAIAYEKEQQPAKSYVASPRPPPKLRRTCWDLWLSCGSDRKEFLVAFNGNVVPVASARRKRASTLRARSLHG